MRMTPIGNFPAGYECVSGSVGSPNILSTKWLVPGGEPVYAHVVFTPEEPATETFWERICERVQHHVHSRLLKTQTYANGVTQYKGMALSDKPPATGDTHVRITPSPSFEGRRCPTVDGQSYDLHPVGAAGTAAVDPVPGDPAA